MHELDNTLTEGGLRTGSAAGALRRIENHAVFGMPQSLDADQGSVVTSEKVRILDIKLPSMIDYEPRRVSARPRIAAL